MILEQSSVGGFGRISNWLWCQLEIDGENFLESFLRTDAIDDLRDVEC